MGLTVLVKLRGMGDTVFLRPWIAAWLQATKGHPEEKIQVIVPEAWAPVLAMAPMGIPGDEGRVQCDYLPRQLNGLARDIWLWRQFRSADSLVILHSSHRLGRLAWLSGVKKRVCHHHHPHQQDTGSTVSIPHKHQVRSALERDFDSLRALGLWGNDTPALCLSPPERRYPAEDYVAILPEASRATKTWPYWKQLLEMGLPLRTKTIRVADGLSLPEVLRIVGKAQAVIGNDTGLLHAAVALGVPTFCLMGPENPAEWHPHEAPKHALLWLSLNCRNQGDLAAPYCGKIYCHHHSCLASFSAAYVHQQICEFLRINGLAA